MRPERLLTSESDSSCLSTRGGTLCESGRAALLFGADADVDASDECKSFAELSLKTTVQIL